MPSLCRIEPLQHFDALVIGGGPASLAGALYLARFRRSVLVVDEGRGRALRITRLHNVAGFPEGVNGARLVGDMRQHAEAHGARFAAGRMRSLERESSEKAGFVARWDDGSAHASFVLLATGATDVRSLKLFGTDPSVTIGGREPRPQPDQPRDRQGGAGRIGPPPGAGRPGAGDVLALP